MWPDYASILDDEILKTARSEVSAIANAVSRFEPVIMYTRSRNVQEATETVSENVTVRGLDASQLWVRDTGPVFVKNTGDGSSAGLSLNFNYWGGKLLREGDESVATNILSDMETRIIKAPFQAEGGGIEVDGQGTLLATESAILNENRNPGMSREELERYFKTFLGINKTIWLRGVQGYDITDYHIDAFARFISPGVVLLARPPQTAQKVVQEAYRQAKKVLSQATDAKDRRLKVVEVAEINSNDLSGETYGETVVASYANYLVVNGGLIVPKFGVEADDDAMRMFRGLFPGREVVQVGLNTLPKLGGGIHCATQQVPM